MYNIKDKQKVTCPLCGELPEVIPVFWGRAYKAECSSCGWHGTTVDVCQNPFNAIDAWEDKAIEYEIDHIED